MYGKVMSMSDQQIRPYLELCTRTPMSEIESVMSGHPREAKMTLAYTMVEMYHSKEAAQKAAAGFMKPNDAPELRLPAGATARSLAEPLHVSMSELRRLIELFCPVKATRPVQARGDPVRTSDQVLLLIPEMGQNLVSWRHVDSKPKILVRILSTLPRDPIHHYHGRHEDGDDQLEVRHSSPPFG